MAPTTEELNLVLQVLAGRSPAIDDTGQLSALDGRRRRFHHLIRTAVILRDQWCRTPYCGAPLRHVDHPMPVADGGVTTEANGQGLCERCNYAKEAFG